MTLVTLVVRTEQGLQRLLDFLTRFTAAVTPWILGLRVPLGDLRLRAVASVDREAVCRALRRLSGVTEHPRGKR